MSTVHHDLTARRWFGRTYDELREGEQFIEQTAEAHPAVRPHLWPCDGSPLFLKSLDVF